MHHKHRSWQLLCDLHIRDSFSWVYVGGFNEILYHSKKMGETSRPTQYVDAFQGVLYEIGLYNLGFLGIYLHGIMNVRV